ncbi:MULTISPECIES: 2'-5' RNA ligase family protein [unclassified Streptomyces]|uniref:2'-5' RNA ligase family protein n=1 Tax=unclassified Streptomyces TaxID=2593676 RepID=UPI00224D9B94|nr:MULTISPECIES: 2'-5' RNA ligase family protein [unclassified Streptomyces]MCX5055003.1 2'-5' RNA ligase family protein [Streptomyces sp. NBC_00474]MCX5063392.1 2'-5' RNA ligase family protein [Streptomyces sp. NBC_00452]MCX5251245.1 2'-5' RNA ligase family protein [Streptomyces sp. NBC_00201]MCX5294832.1 2'-5' RNA ligase family protein [Streptomyces sp. NBC_00183]
MADADDDSERFVTGQTALVVPVPEAEASVRVWRDRFDPAARAGVPAHVTVLFPFLHASLVDDGTCAALDEVFGRHPSFDVRFEECGRFPGVLYLAPAPAAPFRRLTEAVVDRWPQAPPYGGKYDPHPHLTVAQGQDDAVLDEIESGLRPGLPFAARVPTVDLVVYGDTDWQHRASFALR